MRVWRGPRTVSMRIESKTVSIAPLKRALTSAPPVPSRRGSPSGTQSAGGDTYGPVRCDAGTDVNSRRLGGVGDVAL